MNSIMQKLESNGCDMKGVMNRMLDDETFYVSLLSEAINDDGFKQLGMALSQGDVTGAFECAYRLKGMLANMGFTSLYKMASGMEARLRKGNLNGVIDIYTQFIAERENYVELIFS